MSRSNRLLSALVLGALTLGFAIVALMVSARPTALPPPTGAASPSANATLSPNRSPVAAQVSPSPTPRGTHENLVLGYRITLPEGYRRSSAIVVTAPGHALGSDTYTVVTEEEERAACKQDAGHFPRVPALPDIHIAASRNPQGLSAHEWATTPRQPGGAVLSTHQKVEPTTIGGNAAVRLVQDNATATTTAFVVRDGDRTFQITSGNSSSTLPRTWLDDIAKTFATVSPNAFPSATPTTAPQMGAREVAQALAAAFAAKDAAAVAGLMPECWISLVYAIDGEVPGQGGNNRSVHLFVPLLRDRFAAGDLSVNVDPSLRQGTRFGPETFFVRSEWREPDRTVPIDLVLGLRDGRWTWMSAIHYFSSAQLGVSRCVPYRSPWVSGTGAC